MAPTSGDGTGSFRKAACPVKEVCMEGHYLAASHQGRTRRATGPMGVTSDVPSNPVDNRRKARLPDIA